VRLVQRRVTIERIPLLASSPKQTAFRKHRIDRTNDKPLYMGRTLGRSIAIVLLPVSSAIESLNHDGHALARFAKHLAMHLCWAVWVI
jgi:hypothetical protein